MTQVSSRFVVVDTDRPPAVMSVVGSIANVCAWHLPQPVAKNAADAWAKAQNLTPSHGCCEECKRREFPELGTQAKPVRNPRMKYAGEFDP
jgi:hypothetical protein